MDRLDRGQLVETVGIAPGEEVLAGALIGRAAATGMDRCRSPATIPSEVVQVFCLLLILAPSRRANVWI